MPDALRCAGEARPVDRKVLLTTDSYRHHQFDDG
jgi:hypothetical protein